MLTRSITWVLLSAITVPPLLAAQEEIDWSQNAASLRGRNGEQFVFLCPATNRQGNLWGTGTYSDDSSICSAAVHAGAITPSGGYVLIEIRPGQSSYTASEANGMTSSGWGQWAGSFVVIDGAISWSANATLITGDEGDIVKLLCAPGGSAETVWGSGPYTDDSSICTAAVHAGSITFTEGGPVTIEIRGGRSSFPGSRRNGVATLDYGSWGRSFMVR